MLQCCERVKDEITTFLEAVVSRVSTLSPGEISVAMEHFSNADNAERAIKELR